LFGEARQRRVGLIGFGAVGSTLTQLIAEGRGGGGLSIVSVLVRHPDRHPPSAASGAVPFVPDVEALLRLKPDVVVEAAGHDAVRIHLPAILRAGIDVLAISVGALAEPAAMDAVTAAARAGRSQLRVPSGAIAGLDAIGAAAIGELERVLHVVRKPPGALLAPEEARSVLAGGRARELFAGSAREAALRFPANANVVAAVALAGLGLDRTEARVMADPRVSRNTHEICAEGTFGRLLVRIENTPSENPKTGRIVPLSLLRALRDLDAAVVIGG
jgi:aspartate dehydrogenase